MYEHDGMSGSPLKGVWYDMRKRCYSKNVKDYKNYGARGVTLCDEWYVSFAPFYEWSLKNGYAKGLTIDRKNNDGDYSPENCRWVSRSIQNRNTRKLQSNNTSGYRGVTFNKKLKKFQAQIGVNKKLIQLGLFDLAEDAADAYNKYVIENNLEHTRN